MSLTPGTRFGAFEIISPLGAGGMGEVYRARDTRLDRPVAIKVLLESFASDPDRLGRFEREAKLLASLNHPHIAQIHGLEEGGGTRALVMELVEGPTLADRIAEGPVPLDEALAIARQIGDALEAAHEQGIVHRDLKPANIKLRPDGTVKVLDFGLAKLAEPGGASGSSGAGALTMSPTITSPAMTQAGVILGTAAYMSPEQARGKAVDKRADIWAFGVVLFEMLTGARPFKGDDLTETLASVVKDQPDLEKVPAQVRRLIARCLEKDPRRRLRDIGDVWDLLDDTAARSTAVAAATAGSRRIVPWGVAAASALLAAAIAAVHFREPAAPAASVVRFQMSAAPTQAGTPTPAISPDGKRIVYQQGSQLFVRELDTTVPRVLTTSDAGLAAPFWSADSRFVIYDSAGKLTKMDASGGPPQMICELSGLMVGGFATRDGQIIFNTVPGGLRQVPARGGEATQLGRLRQVVVSSGSSLLPDGRRFVYAETAVAGSEGVYVNALDGSGDPVRVLSGAIQAVAYVPDRKDGGGHLLFRMGRTLLAQSFDSKTLRVIGEPVTVAERVSGFSASESGAIVYNDIGEGRRLMWVNRDGSAAGTVWAPGQYNEVSLSRDGSRMAVVRADGTATWIHEFAREASFKLSSGAVKPVWSPDGTRMALASSTEGHFDIYVAPANGAGPRELVYKSADSKYPTSWSADGRWLLYTSVDPSTRHDLWVMPMAGTGERKPEPFLVTNYRESDSTFSPDGHFVAYVSDESGTPEVYVRSFPASTGGKWAVSNGGGYQPRWRADGKELLYLSGRSQLMSVETTLGQSFAASSPRSLFAATIYGGGSSINNWYWDIAPDGKRMLFNAGSAETGTALVTVVLNWQAGLKAGS